MMMILDKRKVPTLSVPFHSIPYHIIIILDWRLPLLPLFWFVYFFHLMIATNGYGQIDRIK